MRFTSAVFKVLFGCGPANQKIVNQDQFKLVKKDCQGKTACKVDASRKYFGNSECPGTDEKKMRLWVGSSCEGKVAATNTRGHNDKVARLYSRGYSGKPECNSPSHDDIINQLDVRGCGGWVKLNCSGGSLNILKVLDSVLTVS